MPRGCGSLQSICERQIAGWNPGSTTWPWHPRSCCHRGSSRHLRAPFRREAGSKLQAAKPRGLGALVFDIEVLTDADVGHGVVELQSIYECLSVETRGRNCKLQRPGGDRLALKPSSLITFISRLMWVTVRLDLSASASASQGKRRVEIASSKDPENTAWPWRHRL